MKILIETISEIFETVRIFKIFYFWEDFRSKLVSDTVFRER